MSNLRDFIIGNGVLIKYTGTGRDVVIPESVTTVGENAFYGCTSLTSITIPESVTEIGLSAFRNCSNLASITIPDSVKEIGSSAFEGCSLCAYNIKSITYVDKWVIHASKNIRYADIEVGTRGIADRAFSLCDSLTHVMIPEGITEIGSQAFYGCDSLSFIDIPEGINKIGVAAFRNCSLLTSIAIPESVEEIDSQAFYGCSNLISINIPKGVSAIDCYVFKDCCRLTNISIPKIVKKIGISAFSGCSKLTEINIPESVTEIGEEAFQGCYKLSHITIPEKTKLKPNMFGGKLPPALTENPLIYLPNMTDAMIRLAVFDSGLWETLPVNTQADIFLDKQGKLLLPVYQDNTTDPISLGNEIFKRIDEKSPSKICNAAATFMILFRDKLDESILREFYNQLKSIKAAKKALEKISKDEPLIAKLGSMNTIVENLPPIERKITEYLTKESLSSSALEKRFHDYYSKINLPIVYYKNGKKVTPIVLQWLLTTHEQIKMEYYQPVTVPAYKKPGISLQASEIVESLDNTSFQYALRRLALKNLGIVGSSKKMYLAYPICRYADEALMADLTKKAPKWRSSVSGNDAPPLRTFRKACLYSNTRAAMLFADRFHDLEEYAAIRGTTADVIRDQYLSDVGINERGEKVYDLGNQIVTAVLQPDLSFLIRKADGKTAKSLPKKDSDPEKYDAANADFSEMKKNAKKIVKSRRTILFEDFLSGRFRSADDWKNAYLQNPLLRSVAKLLVWQQGDFTFTLNESGAIQADGTVYEINNSPISAAHPMEMKPAQVEAWQKYFTTHALKQPFAQIWEPVIDPAVIQKDRYKNCMIPYYRFRSMDKHGIHVEDENFHSYIDIAFDGCEADIERIDDWGHEINNDDRFEVTSFSFKKYTRQVNHIVAYLDRITIYDRILKDDITIETFLPSFTLAQITDFIKLATENSCPNVTALLLNYKNEHFADFDPMEEFTLGEL